ncbi:MAG: putative Zn-dependent oxidoreductase, NADPH:quinone reductase [Frankiales bacterium]|nr:putative Zn-dependent oxidoreductase, NADPH:quinone reductase [Frankiales bacterium]
MPWLPDRLPRPGDRPRLRSHSGVGGVDIIDIPEPVPGPGQKLFDVSMAGVNFADTHHRQSPN